MQKINANELTRLEQQYSGGFEFVRPPIASEHDTVKAPHSVFHGHRFQPRGTCKKRAHDYAQRYAEALERFNRTDPLVVVEMGILRGVGLAVWCDVFPNARVIGLEIDLTHWHENLGNLTQRGAFRRNSPEVCRYDELSPDAPSELKAILGHAKIDVFIDDALHYDAAIVKAFCDVRPSMHPHGVYLIEDNYHVGRALQTRFTGWHTVRQEQELTVITDF